MPYTLRSMPVARTSQLRSFPLFEFLQRFLPFLGGDTGEAGFDFEIHQGFQADFAPGHLQSLFNHFQ